ncbi:hypothetical protein SNOG_07155 [Parastagonospora nodorum SN15]|uniref:Uncharacterized protein n=1 Tax=Phaeosphaeria nodorum (strain SN15 / ATCC MYA-4574 / FGSC 10173) TaxID=321614 RepID=Q0UM59_PHANO|nr:hypothetical protein SNOG_07155 [Parastagonospora nodorum SN15]EAT85806.1 hypothetical protein SNOG_07155 [Parastagonospora nodorum SN15]
MCNFAEIVIPIRCEWCNWLRKAPELLNPSCGRVDGS